MSNDVAGEYLVWAAHQLEQWSQRLASECGQEPPEFDQVLKREDELEQEAIDRYLDMLEG